MNLGQLCLAAHILCVVSGCARRQPQPAESPVSAVEITKDGEELPIPPNGITDIDENSSIKLVVAKSLAQRAMAASAKVDPKKLDELDQRIALLKSAIVSQQDVLSALTAVLNTPPAERVAARDALHQKESKAHRALKSVFSRDELNAVYGQPGQTSYYAAISHLTALGTKVAADLDEISKGLNRVRWRMQSTLYTRSGPRDVHLDDYDDLSVGEPYAIDRLAVPKNLLRTLDDARVVASQMRDLETTLAQARSSFQTRLGVLREQLLAVLDSLEALQTIANRVLQVQLVGVNLPKTESALVISVLTDVRSIATSCRDGFAATQALRELPTIDLSQRLRDRSSAVRACAQLAARKGPELVDKIARLRDVAQSNSTLARVVTAQTIKDLEALVSKIDISATVEKSSFWEPFEELFSADLGTGPTGTAPGHALDRAYREVQNTSISLLRTQRAPGDLLYYRAAVVKDGQETQQWTSSPMRVTVTGLRVDVSASVVFVRALQSQPEDSSFPAAPAATAALHYGVRRNAYQNRGGRLWNFLDPGLGLHVAYLNLGPKASSSSPQRRDPAAEVGVGATLQFFGDVLQCGLAYDLQVERPYAFFGVGLQTATNFGLTTPAGGHN